MKYRLFAAVLLLAVLACIAIATQNETQSQVAAPPSSGVDDNSMKSLTIN